MIAAHIATRVKGGQPKTNAQICAFTSQEEACQRLNVSRGSIQSATQVKEKAVPEVVEAVRDGHIKGRGCIADIGRYPRRTAADRFRRSHPH